MVSLHHESMDGMGRGQERVTGGGMMCTIRGRGWKMRHVQSVLYPKSYVESPKMNQPKRKHVDTRKQK